MTRPVSLIVLTLIFTTGPAWAVFEYPHASARAAAMGHSFLAVKTEPAAVFSNPGALAPSREPQASFLYAKPFAGLEGVNLNAAHAAVVLPTRAGRLGLGVARLDVSGLMSEQTVALGYGVTLPGRVQAGVAARHLTLAYRPGSDPLAANDPVFRNGVSNTAVAFDASATAPLGPSLELGLAVRNINRPDIGLATEDRITRDVHAGLAVTLAGAGIRAVGAVNIREAGDGPKRDPVPHMGLEKTFANNPLSLRVGADTNEYTAGFGLRLKTFTVDYGFILNRNLARDNAGSHQLGLSYQWRRAPRE